jgi:hypothetical protein
MSEVSFKLFVQIFSTSLLNSYRPAVKKGNENTKAPKPNKFDKKNRDHIFEEISIV